MSGNGGGSEIRFVRFDGYLQVAENGDFLEHLQPRVYGTYFKRRWITREQWVNVNAIWDDNWECDNLEQGFAIYEEDNEGTLTINGSITTNVTLPSTNDTITMTVGFENSFVSKDELITQWVINADSFFRTNRLDNGCQLRLMPEYGNLEFAKYDCGTNAIYVLPNDYLN